VERVLPHKHCPECGLAISLKEEFSSKDCEKAHKERLKGKKRQLLYLYFGGVVLFGFAMLLLYGRGG
jgi:predicted nucleic acid-binding Zn ribbon protein